MGSHCRPDGSLGHNVYRKPIKTNLYLNALSYHHPAQITAVLHTLVHTAWVVSDAESLDEELNFLCTIFRNNGYTSRDINWALKYTRTSFQSDDQ